MKRINLEHDDYGSFAKKQLATLRVKLASAGNNGDLEPVVIDAHALAARGKSRFARRDTLFSSGNTSGRLPIPDFYHGLLRPPFEPSLRWNLLDR